MFSGPPPPQRPGHPSRKARRGPAKPEDQRDREENESPSPLEGEGKQGGSKLPPSRTPLLVRDVGGASGASLRAWARRPWSREDGLTRSGEAHSYARRSFRPSVLAREGWGGG